MASVMAFFDGGPGDLLDIRCHQIFEDFDGEFIGDGTCLDIGERDVQYDVPDELVDQCRRKLKEAGFRLQPRPDNWAWSTSEAIEQQFIARGWQKGAGHA